MQRTATGGPKDDLAGPGGWGAGSGGLWSFLLGATTLARLFKFNCLFVNKKFKN